MNTKLVIIIPNEQQVKIPLFVKKCDYHTEGIKNFVFHNDINLYGKEFSISFTEIAFELVEQGYLVMATDEFENRKTLIIFLPNEISEKQLEYFNKRKEKLKDYNIMFYSYDKDKKLKIYDKTTIKVHEKSNYDNTVFDYLIKELNTKLQSINKTKNLKKD